MKKFVIFLFAVLTTILFWGSCSSNKTNDYDDTDISQSMKNGISEHSSAIASYMILLENFCAESDIIRFALRDLDNDGIPELLIIQEDENALNAVLTVYSYGDNVYKIGDYSNTENSFKSILRFSNNSKFPGLFDFCWGGGIDHYTYLTIKEGKLVSEYIWYEDRTVEPSQKVEISSNKQLINECIDVYTNWDSPDNLLEIYFINDDNISQIPMLYP